MERNGVYEFTLNVNHSVANALRRTITADIPVLAAGLMLIALFFVVINMAVDLLYLAADPRLRQERHHAG